MQGGDGRQSQPGNRPGTPTQRVREVPTQFVAVRPKDKRRQYNAPGRKNEKGARPDKPQPRRQPSEEPIRVAKAPAPVKNTLSADRRRRKPVAYQAGALLKQTTLLRYAHELLEFFSG